MTKHAAFCRNLAERAPESETAPAFKKGSCCEKSFPSIEQLSSHLNDKTQCGSPVPLRLQHGGHVFCAAGWLRWRHRLVCQSGERKWCPQRYSEQFFSRNPSINKHGNAESRPFQSLHLICIWSFISCRLIVESAKGRDGYNFKRMARRRLTEKVGDVGGFFPRVNSSCISLQLCVKRMNYRCTASILAG